MTFKLLTGSAPSLGSLYLPDKKDCGSDDRSSFKYLPDQLEAKHKAETASCHYITVPMTQRLAPCESSIFLFPSALVNRPDVTGRGAPETDFK